MKEIVDALLTLRKAFLSQNMSVPTVVELASAEEGKRFLSMVIKYFEPEVYGAPFTLELSEDERFTFVRITGIVVRWPSTFVALHGGTRGYR